MKKTFLLSILLFSLLGTGFAQSVVRVTDPTVTTGASPSITFEVGWASASTSSFHRDTVWLFADYQVLNTDGTTEAWQPATITDVVHSGGTPSYPVTLPYRGFYLNGHGVEPFASTVTITLTAPVNKRFNACVYASDYPPNATLQSGGSYTLKGTPPFIINDTIRETSHTFGAGTCITSITDSTGCPGFVVYPPIVTGEILSIGDTVCIGGTPKEITGIATYSGGDGVLSYSWYKDGILIDGATGANYTPPVSDAAEAGTYAYTRRVADQTCYVSPVASTGSWVLTVGDFPTVTLAAASATVCDGSTVTLTATAAGAASYQFNNNGNWQAGSTTPATVTSDTTFTVKARSALGCESAEATATVEIDPNICLAAIHCVPATFTLDAVGFSGSTYQRGTLTISSPVTVTYCSSRTYTDFDGGTSGTYKADCTPSQRSSFDGDLMSWCFVMQYAEQLCPSPWRVPTREDHCYIVNGDPTDCSVIGSTFNGSYGYAYTGRAHAGNASTGGVGYYWSSTEYDTYNDNNAYCLYFTPNTTYTAYDQDKYYGLALRCVQDTP